MKEPFHSYKDPNRRLHAWESCWLGSGITDKHGYEIYEGDIVKLKDGKTYPVVFAEGMFMLDNAPLKLFAGEVEVIGHIQENNQ